MRMFGVVVFCLFSYLSCSEVSAFSCSFDSGLCGFTQRKDDRFDWTRKSYSTPSQGTGPDGDHTSGTGHFMFIEASNRRKGDNAVLERRVSVARGQCLSFYYHMFGYSRHVGSLNVYLGSQKIYSRSGNQGQRWISVQITLAQSGELTLAFEGVVGGGFLGDIAIDDVSLGQCDGQATPPPPTAPPVIPTDPPTMRPGTPSPPGSCGLRPNTRIVGGTTANHGDWPWQAQLKGSSGSSPFCGGTLIHPQWVLTASHCVSGSSAIKTIVRLGAHRRSALVGTEQDFKVTKVITHPSYHKPLRYSNDIALLKLERPARLDRYTNLACLPDNEPSPTDGTKCWITGFGRTQGNSQSREYLQQASIPIVSEQRCRFAYMGQIHDSMICAGLDRGGIDSCQGDSGGPMVCESGGRFFIHGVTSWGSGCARPGKFGVYARVTYEMSWVRQEISRN